MVDMGAPNRSYWGLFVLLGGSKAVFWEALLEHWLLGSHGDMQVQTAGSTALAPEAPEATGDVSRVGCKISHPCKKMQIRVYA